MKFTTVFINLILAVLVLFSSWTIYYKLPIIPVYILFLFLVIVFNQPFTTRQLLFYLLFTIIAFRFYLVEEFSIDSVLLASVRSLSLGSVFLIKPFNQKRIIDNIIILMAIIVSIGLLFHVLSLTELIKPPIIEQLTMQDGRLYNVYFLHVYEVSRYSGIELSARFNSIFDEPGYLGTISALILIVEKLKFKRWRNVIIGIAGIFTLSLAFYFLIILYILLRSLKSNKQLLIRTVAITVLFIVFILVFPFIWETLSSRLSFDSGYGLAGDSRGGLWAFNESVGILLSQNYFSLLFGNGYDSFLKYQGYYISNSNIYRLVLQIGLFGILYFLYLIIKFKKSNFEGTVFLIVFTLSIYQRPQIFEFIFLILLGLNLNLYNLNEKKDLDYH